MTYDLPQPCHRHLYRGTVEFDLEVPPPLLFFCCANLVLAGLMLLVDAATCTVPCAGLVVVVVAVRGDG